MDVIPGFSPERQRLFQIFHPYAFAKTLDAARQETRFVHYTSAETAMQIFRNREVWMRKSSCMNDFMEIEHGLECLVAAYEKHKQNLKSILDEMFPGICEDLEEYFSAWLPHFRTDTYITCISEHHDSEDAIGRLSMWRAYGGTTGVAIVLKGTPFLRPSEALGVFTSPVAYLSKTGFDAEFETFVNGLRLNKELITPEGKEYLLTRIFEAFRFAILCTKHPGFHEEKEWRIIYTPTYRKSSRLTTDVRSIRGAPQPIYKIALKDIPEEGLLGIEIPTFVDRVIVGPTQYPLAIREAFITLLREAGMKDAADRVFVSDIPLRQ